MRHRTGDERRVEEDADEGGAEVVPGEEDVGDRALRRVERPHAGGDAEEREQVEDQAGEGEQREHAERRVRAQHIPAGAGESQPALPASAGR